MARTKHDEAVQALALEGEDEALREGVQVWTPRRQLPHNLELEQVRIAGFFYEDGGHIP
ncbi:MAG: hypothetical protein U0638_16675 [Phycisphaerales bacterium]